MRKKHSIETPNRLNVDEIFNEHIQGHNKKSDLCLVTYDFNLIYDKKSSHFSLANDKLRLGLRLTGTSIRDTWMFQREFSKPLQVTSVAARLIG